MREDGDAEAGDAIRRTRARGTGRNPGRARAGASTPPSDEANRVARNQDLIGQMTERGNMNAAWRKVGRNGGSAGIDGRDMDATLAYVKDRWETIEAQLAAGTYRPDPVRRVEIEKPGGGIRKLGIPTILDRVLQQAALQVLGPMFDPQFSERSYGLTQSQAPSGFAQHFVLPISASLRPSRAQRGTGGRTGPQVPRRRQELGGGHGLEGFLRRSEPRPSNGACASFG